MSETEVMTQHECVALLRAHHVGRLGVLDEGWPTIVPVNYAMDGDAVVVRTDAGAKFTAVRHGAEVTFEIDAIDPLYRAGWSVMVRGHAAEVVDPDDLERLQALGLEPWHRHAKPFWLRIDPILVTGRRLARAWQYPDRVR